MLGLGNSIVGGVVIAPQSEFSVLFDGTNDHIKTGGDASTKPTSAMTISSWVNMDTSVGGYGWPNPDGSVTAFNQFIVGCLAVGGFGLRIRYSGTASNPITYIETLARVTDNSSGSAGYLHAYYWDKDDFGPETSAANAGVNVAVADGPPIAAGVAWGGYTSGSNTLSIIKDLTGFVHVATTWGAGVMKLYVNGVLKRTADTGVSSGNNIVYQADDAREVMIGADLSSGSTAAEYLDGLIDDVAIWDAAIDADGITEIYGAGPLGLDLTAASGNYDNQGDLQGWWKLDEGTGTSAADSSTNSNTGTLVNGPTWSTITAG
jgi:hypothetical protein